MLSLSKPAREAYTLSGAQVRRFQAAISAVSQHVTQSQVGAAGENAIQTNVAFAGTMIGDALPYARVFAQHLREEKQRIVDVVDRQIDSAPDSDATVVASFRALRRRLDAIPLPLHVPPTVAAADGIYLAPDQVDRVGAALARAAGVTLQVEPGAYGRIRLAQDILAEASPTHMGELIAQLALRDEARHLVKETMWSLPSGSQGRPALEQALVAIAPGSVSGIVAEEATLEGADSAAPTGGPDGTRDERPERLAEMQECIDEQAAEIQRLHRDRDAQVAAATLVRDAVARYSIQAMGLAPRPILDGEQRVSLRDLEDAVAVLEQASGLESASTVARNTEAPEGLTFLDRAKLASVAVSRWAATESPEIAAVGEGAMFRALWVGLRAAGVRALDPQVHASTGIPTGGLAIGRVGAAPEATASPPPSVAMAAVMEP